MPCVYERYVGFRDHAREIDEDGGPRDRARQIEDEKARRRLVTTGAVTDRIVEEDGTGTHIAMPDDGDPDSVAASLSGAGKTLVGSFPPGNYVTVMTASGFHVYRMDPASVDLGNTYGTTFGNTYGNTSDSAYGRASFAGKAGLNAAAVARRTTDRIRAINATNAAFWSKRGG
jgi:hypothetical protein